MGPSDRRDPSLFKKTNSAQTLDINSDYQSNPLPAATVATQQHQHTRTASETTNAYPSYQEPQPHTQAQTQYRIQTYHGGSYANGSQSAGETQSRIVASTEQTPTGQISLTDANQQTSSYDETTAVNLSAVYDPWPEYKRKAEALKVAQEAEEAKAAAKRAFHETDEKSKTEKMKRIEEERRRMAEVQHRTDEEFQHAETPEKEQASAAPQNSLAKERQESANGNSTTEATSKANTRSTPAPGPRNASLSPDIAQMLNGAADSADPEGQIRALMAMVKQMNDKHPSLLAKIWEQERQEHLRATSQSPATTPAKPVDPTTDTGEMQSGTAQPGSSTVSSKTAPPPSKAIEGLQSTPKPKAPAPKAPQSKVVSSNPATRGNTIWPTEKRVQLAISAAQWLNAYPGNRNNQIQPADIEMIFDSCPTYIKLCERLEGMKLKLDRAAFARALLQYVPAVNKPAPQRNVMLDSNKKTYTPGETFNTLQQTRDRAPSGPPALARSNISSVQQPNFPAGNFGHEPRHQSSVLGTSTTPATTTDYTYSPSTNPPFQPSRSPYFESSRLAISSKPQPKAPMAQMKRVESRNSATSISEPTSSSLPLESSSKAAATQKRTFANIVDLTASDEEDPPAKLQRSTHSGPAPVTVPEKAHQPPSNYLPEEFGDNSLVTPYLRQGGSVRDDHRPSFPALPRIDKRRRQAELAKPIDRRKALRRSGYDTTSIARDVLLATGKHPDMVPLNAHLDPLRAAFPKQIDYYADLETIRWDLLDPDEGISIETVLDDDRDSVLDGSNDESEDGRVDRVLSSMRPQVVVNHNVIASGGEASSYQIVDGGLGRISGVKGSMLKRIPGRPFDSRPTGPGGGQQLPVAGWQALQNASPQRRGRPSNSTQPEIGDAQPPPPAAPGYSAFTRVDADGKPVKKRGRPVGWRKDLHQRGVGLYGGGSGTEHMPKKSSTKRNTANATDSLPEVKYAVYNCKWKDCKAKLHNLDTLRKHLNKMHGKVDEEGTFTCKWEDCGKNVQTVNQSAGEITQSHQYHYFPDLKLWSDHIEKTHVVPVAWKLGDGPPGGVSGMSTRRAPITVYSNLSRRP
jgi:hypothetical protein